MEWTRDHEGDMVYSNRDSGVTLPALTYEGDYLARLQRLRDSHPIAELEPEQSNQSPEDTTAA